MFKGNILHTVRKNCAMVIEEYYMVTSKNPYEKEEKSDIIRK